MHKELNQEALFDLVSQLPPKATGEQIINLIVNVIEVYGMGDNWFNIAVSIGHVLEQLNDEHIKSATIH
jgi:hypothetical protein